MTSLLVASGIGVVGVVPALAAGDSPAPAAFHSDHDRDHDRLFRDRGDVRYVWFRVCDTDGTTTTTTATGEALDPGTTTETVAPDAVAAAVDGASTETATTGETATATDAVTDTVAAETTTDTTTTEPTAEAATADDPDAKVYPTFIVVPLPKDEAKALRKLDDRPCYDLITGAPATTDTTTTTTTTDVPADAATVTETTTETLVNTEITG